LIRRRENGVLPPGQRRKLSEARGPEGRNLQPGTERPSTGM
jgi:hypothetical protein